MSERDETNPERLRTLAEYGDHYHDERAVLAAELLDARARLAAAERERAAADALVDECDRIRNLDPVLCERLEALAAAYRASRGAR